MKRTRSSKIQQKNDKMTKPEIVCLGFGLGESDRIRLNNLHEFCLKTTEMTIIGANESHSQESEKLGCLYEHREVIFSSTSGLAEIITSNTLIVLLDYFWLQHGYYKVRYGITWAVPGGQVEYLLTKTNVNQVILPLDTSHDLIQSIEANENFLKNFCTVKYWSHQEAINQHPLVRSDQCVDTAIPKDRGSCTDQLERYTPKERAFVVFERKK